MPAQYFRAAFRAHQATTGALIVNVLHYELDSLTSGVSFQDVATDVSQHLGTEWRNILSTHEIFDDVTCTVEDYSGAVPAQGIVPWNFAGSRVVADQNLSLAICALGSWRTQTPKRYARGHTFFPPSVTSQGLDTLGLFNTSSPYYVACQAFADKYAAQFTVGNSTYTPIVFSRTRAKQNVTPFIFPVTAHSVLLPQHFLRSRLTSP